jgi:hypothetical protein
MSGKFNTKGDRRGNLELNNRKGVVNINRNERRRNEDLKDAIGGE